MINISEVEFYQKNAGKSYDKSNLQDVEAKDKLNVLLKKITSSAKKARISLFGESGLKECFTPLPHVIEAKEHSAIRPYLFARFSPENKYSPIATYWFFVEGRPEHKDKHFRISLSLYDNNSSESLLQKCRSLHTEYKLENSISLETDITENELAEWIVNSIEEFGINYEEFCAKLQPDLEEALSKLSDKKSKKQNDASDPNFWKMSHGKEKDISEKSHEWLMSNQMIAIGYAPEHNQRKKFERMQDGDYFYLVRNSKVVLLGQVDGEQIIDTPEHLDRPHWIMRKFRKIKSPVRELNSSQVAGREGWKPQNASTVNIVKNNELAEFEKTILEPAFDLRLIDLMEANYKNSTGKQVAREKETNMLNRILYGPPGTGKTFNTVNEALKIADPTFEVTGKTRQAVKARFDELINEGQIVFTTFHQSMSYEDFIEGIKPETENGRVTYEIKEGIFKKICESAKTPDQLGFETAYNNLQKELKEIESLTLKTAKGRDFSISLNSQGNLTLFTSQEKNQQGSLTKENIQKFINGGQVWWESYVKGVVNYLKSKHNYSDNFNAPKKDYVLIIDEINRGNVSQIFGELITLIEDDKRLGMKEEIQVTLPYSKEPFGVPSNVYIIGTMNTADRSVEALDAALRRRFSFIEMPPRPDLISTHGKLKDTEGILDLDGSRTISLPSLLETLNKRIQKLLDSDHQIGHSFFLAVSSLDELRNSFQNKIIPLLKEYFYGDFGKLGLVLGEGFFENLGNTDAQIFAKFGDFDAADFNEKVVYKLKDFSSDSSNQDFLTAISELLKS